MPQKLEKYQPPVAKLKAKRVKKLKYADMYQFALNNKGYWVKFSKDEDFKNDFFRPTASDNQLARSIEQGVRLCDRINKGADHTISFRNVSRDGFELLVRNRKKKEAEVQPVYTSPFPSEAMDSTVPVTGKLVITPQTRIHEHSE